MEWVKTQCGSLLNLDYVDVICTADVEDNRYIIRGWEYNPMAEEDECMTLAEYDNKEERDIAYARLLNDISKTCNIHQVEGNGGKNAQ